MMLRRLVGVAIILFLAGVLYLYVTGVWFRQPELTPLQQIKADEHIERESLQDTKSPPIIH